jgi:hypothetical protein
VGGVLAGLVKRITSTIEVHGVADPDGIAALGRSPGAREAAHG